MWMCQHQNFTNMPQDCVFPFFLKWNPALQINNAIEIYNNTKIVTTKSNIFIYLSKEVVVSLCPRI